MARRESGPLAIGIMLHDFSLGGTEGVATRLAARWAEVGAEVSIFCGSRSGTVSSVGAGIAVVEARPVLRRSEGSRPRLARAAADHFRRNPVDVCLVPANVHWPIMHPLTRAGRRTALIVQLGVALRRKVPAGLGALRLAWQLRDVDALIAPSLAPGGAVRRILGRKLVAMPLAVLGEERPPLVPVAQESRLIVAIGRLSRDKGFDTLIEALARVADPAATLAIVGVGAEEEQLRKLAQRLGVEERVTFAGAADRRLWLDRARVAVVPSRVEAHGTAIVDALAAGRMVVSTACVPAAGLIDSPATGMIVAVSDARRIARSIDAVFAAPATDPALLAEKAERFRINAVADAYLALFASFRR